MYHGPLQKSTERGYMMEVKKTDMDGARFSLKTIFATFGLIMEDIEQEHQDAKGYEVCFYARMDDVYMPALNCVLCSIQDLLERMEAAV